jgi:hypothetical protein
MRNFNVLAALAAASLLGGGVSAKEKSDEPKPKKVCRTEQMSGRITPERICRIVPRPDTATQDNQRKTGAPREAGEGRD